MILKALAKDPKGRWQTAEELSAALAKVPEVSAPPSQPLAATPPPAASTPAPRPNFVPWAVAGAAALVMLVVLARSSHRKPTTIVAPPPPAATRTVAAPAPAAVPASARRHLAQAVEYQARLWCTDALEELDKALRDDESLRDDATVQRTAIACLTPKTRERATRLIVERMGGSARAELERAAATSPNSEVRRGAEVTLERLPR